MSSKRVERRNRPVRTLLQLLLALIFLLPIIWMLAAALHPQGVPLPQTLQLIPSRPTLANFSRVWDVVPILRFTLNSLIVVAIAVPLTIVTGSWAGLAMAQLPKRSQQRWVVLSLAVLMVPGIALWATRFFIYRSIGWLDSYWALVAPAWMGTSPFYVLMFYRAFRRVPRAIFEATRLDGAGVLAMWWQVALPMARPTTIGVAILSFVFYWGDFLSPLLYLDRQTWYTLPVALQLLQQLSRSDWALLMAGATWAAAIPIVLFLLVQPYLHRAGARVD